MAGVEIGDAAERWRSTWERAWGSGDVEAIVALYAPSAEYRAVIFREPRRGPDGVRAYLVENFTAEHEVRCRFAPPLVGPDRAAVEWWSSWIEDGRTLTMAGVTLLRFDDDGLVVDHRDYWNDTDGRHEPFAGW